MPRFVICKINDSARACGTLVQINMGQKITLNLGSFSGENCSQSNCFGISTWWNGMKIIVITGAIAMI